MCYCSSRCPCGFCVSVGMKDEEFSWSSYIKLNKIQTAPKALFQNQNMVREHHMTPDEAIGNVSHFPLDGTVSLQVMKHLIKTKDVHSTFNLCLNTSR